MSTDYPPSRCGGYELQCADAVAHIRRRGHDVRVLAGAAPADHGETADDRHDDVHRELPRFPPDGRPVAAPAAWTAERSAAAVLRRQLAAFQPDVACLWRLGELSMSLPSRLRGAGVAVVGVVCDPWMVDGPQRDPWARLWARRPLAAAVAERTLGVPLRPRFDDTARWLFVSAALRKQVSAAGLPLADAEIVPAGVDLPAFPLAPMKPWSGRLLYAGRLSRLKGVDTALRALVHLNPSMSLEIAGADNRAYERELHTMAAALGVSSRVRFRGPLSRPVLSAAYAGADALLFPVRWQEPFGLVPLEAMARGTPVIGAVSGGPAAYLRDRRTALVVPPDDPVALATAVMRLADDDALRARLRAAGRRAAEAYPAERSHSLIGAALEAEAVAAAMTRSPPLSRAGAVRSGANASRRSAV